VSKITKHKHHLQRFCNNFVKTGFIKTDIEISSSIKNILNILKKELKKRQVEFKETKISALNGFATHYSIEPKKIKYYPDIKKSNITRKVF